MVFKRLAAVAGADKVVICGPVVLRFSKAAPDSSRLHILRPAHFVHIDMSDSIVAGFTDLWRPRNDARPVRRFAYYNIWRVFSPPPQDIPLALCDARSIAHEDVMASDLVYPHRVGETYAFTYNPAHRWYYFPHLEPSEVILLKCYDSKDDGRARFTAHTAFADPTSPPDAAPRESIEVRALVFFAPEKEDAQPGTATASGTTAYAAN